MNTVQHRLAHHFIQHDIGDYPHIKKGVRCCNCQHLSVEINARKSACKKCGENEQISESILRNIQELQLLFPHEKLTTNLVYDWCIEEYSKKIIRGCLEKHFQKTGVRQWTYYK
ncbi:hypothetical protein SH601_10150 [Gracilibacillus sp. S3-1-1]|uniref:Uncharacterized protein n=1 Tax=Gracilibacillus pellucidus TaxID=3095368 RepID=A0ACC6M5V7_9BACI|nr:hypothetical protein [Gracilibacillus sp. S3-1-1]MDX8046341.1 hypothetical protein [Gracilibacillus sp. S3-1-1]